MRYLLLLFIAMPIIEIGMFIQVGGWLGLWPTLLIVVLTAVAGTWMLRQQGVATMMQAQQRLQAGQLPAQEIFEGILLLIGGVLLLTPGFVTDAIGFACLMPWSRRWLAGQIAKRSKGGAVFTHSGASSSSSKEFGVSFGQQKPGPKKPVTGRSDDIIEGDYREVD